MSPSKYRYLRQGITISGLNTASFDRAIDAAQEIFGFFGRVFSHGVRSSWNLMELEGPSLEMSNQYFTPVRDGPTLESVPFQDSIDPHGVLAKISTIVGAHVVHTEDNEVEYCRCFRQLDGEHRFGVMFSLLLTCIEVCYRYEACPLQTFKKGDIVEVQLSFVVVPMKAEASKENSAR